MLKIKPKKNIKPTNENRNELVEMIVYGLSQTNDRFEEGLSDDIQSVQNCINSGNTSSLGIGMGYAFFNLMGQSLNRVLGGDHLGWDGVRKAYTYMYWGWEIQQHDSLRENIGFDCPTQCETSQIVMHSLSLSDGNKQISKWCATFLRNLISMGGAENVGYYDQDFLHFYNALLKAQITNSWFTEGEGSSQLGNYGELLNSTIEQIEFEKVVFDYCDFRLARAFQFNDFLAKKPRKSNDFMYLFEQQWIAIFPFELFALKKIYQMVLDKELLIDAAHPLLSTGLINVSDCRLVEDKLVRDIIEFGESEFKTGWKPLGEITPIV